MIKFLIWRLRNRLAFRIRDLCYKIESWSYKLDVCSACGKNPWSSPSCQNMHLDDDDRNDARSES